jgi:glycogen operon protein
LYDSSGNRELSRVNLEASSDGIWHVYCASLKPGTLYGYRLYGPYDPARGHRFNHHKLLIDPYARQLSGQLHWCDAIFGYRVGDEDSDLSFDARDSGPYVPKSVVVDDHYHWNDRHPRVPWDETIIYETHVRGFTMCHPDVDESIRGTFAGLADPSVLSYVKSLGVTTVELMPIHAFVDDQFLTEKGLKNYWGYNTLNYFSPVSRYLHTRTIGEFKYMVERYHDAGIEIILDVVYNHTAESDHLGPTLSYRGIDNANYYRLQPDNARYYINDSGCGNTLNTSHPAILQMVMDSLRYWVSEMHVDGFRFDLATSLAREPDGINLDHSLFSKIRKDPILSRVKLIAEPWDVGPDGYQLGRFPVDWGEWNDRYRDTVRRFWRGDSAQLPSLASCLHGSSGFFEHNGRHPHASINMVTSHDGFTLLDLVSYGNRHNQANGADNPDGHHANFSENYGVEGTTKDPAINAMRSRQRKNFMATLFLSQGTPMLLAGDESARTQMGNNNAYCQDNKISWNDWSLQESDREFTEFVRQLIALRKNVSLLRRDRFVHGKEHSPSTGFSDIEWHSPSGQPMQEQDWHDPGNSCVGMLLSDVRETGTGSTAIVMLMIFNAVAEPLNFHLPMTRSGRTWRCVLSTADNDQAGPVISSIVVEARSVYVLLA